MLSIIICTKNEEEVIKDCVESVTWADEIVLIDDYSVDKTREIARKYRAKVYKHKWRGFSEQKNYGFRKTSGDWVLFLDADERVTLSLKKELKEIEESKVKFSGYLIPRLNNILGKDLHYGGWYPDYQQRLVKKDKFVKWEGKLHERMVIKGKWGKLRGNIYHITHRGLSWMVEKSIIYSDYEARLMFKKNHPQVKWWSFFRPMAGEFFERLVKKTGWRDGVIGWIEAIYQSFSRFLVYARLWELQMKKKNEL